MIEGNTWRDGCPIALKDLRYITVTHYNFSGKEQLGEMVVQQSIAREVTEIFLNFIR